MGEYEHQNHIIPPVYNEDSRVLILGTMPSPKSRAAAFYYANPQNRFWSIMEKLFNCELKSKENKIDFLLSNNIALWDVVKSCDIISASDSSIKNVVPNDLNKILFNSKIESIFTTGKIAFNLYNKYCYNETKIEAVYLPSTSPANAAWKITDLIKEYSIIYDIIKKQAE